MPQPLRWWPDDITFGANALAERPTLAIGIAGVAAAWAEIEVTLGILLGTILHTEMHTGISMYLSLKGSAAQDAALAAAAKAKLPNDLKRKFEDLLLIMRKRGKERNKIVHGLWGISPQLPDALINCQPEHFIRDLIEVLTDHPKSGASASILNVYDNRDFIAIISRLYDLKDELGKFINSVENAHDQQPEPTQAPTVPPGAGASMPPPAGNQTNPEERS